MNSYILLLIIFDRCSLVSNIVFIFFVDLFVPSFLYAYHNIPYIVLNRKYKFPCKDARPPCHARLDHSCSNTPHVSSPSLALVQTSPFQFHRFPHCHLSLRSLCIVHSIATHPLSCSYLDNHLVRPSSPTIL